MRLKEVRVTNLACEKLRPDSADPPPVCSSRTSRWRVQKALNRGEAYHRFRKAVAYVNGGKFRVQTETEQQIWNECSRLIANAIIFYNAALLSKMYTQKVDAGDQEAMVIIRGVSPVAWQHVNLFGTFESQGTANGGGAQYFREGSFLLKTLQDLVQFLMSEVPEGSTALEGGDLSAARSR